jgi:hypothetical protein
MSCVLILFMAIDVVVVVVLVLWGGGVPLLSFYIQGVGVIRKVTESVTT